MVRAGYIILLFCLISLAFSAFPSRAAAPGLRVTDDGHTAGYVTLAWSVPDGTETGGAAFELQRRVPPDETWERIYVGTDTATTLTGLRNGTYLFRVRRDAEAWSAPLTVEIAHHTLARAAAFFTCGLVLFIILVTVTFWPVDTPALPAQNKAKGNR